MLFSAFLLCLNFSGFIQASKGDPIIGDDVQDFLPDCQARAAEGLCNDKLE